MSLARERFFNSWNPEKWRVQEVVTIMVVPGIIYGAFIAANYFGVKKMCVDANYVGERAKKTKSGRDFCEMLVSTNYGNVAIGRDGLCPRIFHANENVFVWIKVGRITHSPLGMYNSLPLECTTP